MKKTIACLKKIVCLVLTLTFVLPYMKYDMKVNAIKRLTESQDCIDLIVETEGFTKYQYWDYGQWTIGYGTGCQDGEYPNGITEEEAQRLVRKYTSAFAECVNDFAAKYNIQLTQNQFDALVCLSYALGNLWVAYDEFDLKTILINGSENYSFLEIAKAFGEWRLAGGEVLQGLVRRRQLETALFLKDRTDTKTEVWRVNEDNGLNLYSGVGNNTKTGYMVNNTIFAITEKKTASDGALWGKTEYEGGTHWISLVGCVYMVGGPLNYDDNNASNNNVTSTSEKWKITSTNGVKLRGGPGLNYAQVNHIPANTEITVTATTECDGYLWGKTVYNGYSGWCVLDYAVRVSTPVLSGTTLQSIYVSQKPDKLTYNEGDKLDLSGLIVKAVYSDKSEKIIVDYEVSGFESVKGTHDVKITYKKQTTSFRVTVDGKRLTAIKIEALPDKTVYKVGEGLKIKGITVKGTYSNNTQAEIKDFYLENVEGFSKKAGTKTIVVKANDLKTEFEVEVTDKVITDIEVTSAPKVTDYVIGQSLNSDGLIVHAIYSNGTKNVINEDDYTVSGYDASKIGEQTLTVTYNGYSDEFDVNVSEPSIYELPGDLDGSGSRDIFDLVLLNKYIDGVCEFEDDRVYLADVNLDGNVNEKDVEALSRIVSEQ